MPHPWIQSCLWAAMGVLAAMLVIMSSTPLATTQAANTTPNSHAKLFSASRNTTTTRHKNLMCSTICTIDGCINSCVDCVDGGCVLEDPSCTKSCNCTCQVW